MQEPTTNIKSVDYSKRDRAEYLVGTDVRVTYPVSDEAIEFQAVRQVRDWLLSNGYKPAHSANKIEQVQVWGNVPSLYSHVNVTIYARRLDSLD